MTDRAVSVVLDYVILLTIATVMLAGIVTVSGTLIDSQANHGTEEELEVTAESIAADIQAVERLVNTSEPGEATVTMRSVQPSHVGGASYTVTYADGILTLESSSGIHVTTPVASDLLEPTDGSVAGGDLEMHVEDGTMEVRAG